MTDGPRQTRRPSATNHIAPRQARRDADRRVSTRKGDLPPGVLGRYLIERDLRGRAERLFRDHRTDRPAFRDAGRRLSTDRTYPDTVADMLEVARHRGWTRLSVKGDETFRREVWIQGRALGLDVRGYRPRQRDRSAAGLPAPLTPEERLQRAAVVVRGLIADRDAQDRLLARAAERAGLRRDAAAPPRRPDRSRERGAP